MTYGRNPQIDHDIDWVIDEDGNVLGYQRDLRSFAPIVSLSADTGLITNAAQRAAVGEAAGGAQSPYYISKLLSKTGRWATALNSGAAAPRVLICGDSTGVGFGNSSTLTDWRPLGVSKLLADALTSAGKPVQSYQNFFGSGYDVAAQIYSVDSRLSITGSVPITATKSLGGQQPLMTSGNAITFTPGGTFDTVDIYWYGYSGAGSFAVTSNLGSHGTINQSNATSIAGKTTSSLGGNTTYISLTGASGNATPAGVDCYNPSCKSIRFLSGSFGGA